MSGRAHGGHSAGVANTPEIRHRRKGSSLSEQYPKRLVQTVNKSEESLNSSCDGGTPAPGYQKLGVTVLAKHVKGFVNTVPATLSVSAP